MSQIHKKYPLRNYNSFGVEAYANTYVRFSSTADISEFLKHHNLHEKDFLILGEGSNVLFTSDYEGTILHPLIKGIDHRFENEEYVELRVGCGENWDNFTHYCVKMGYHGIENLSLIPGSVGSAPVQNIGAYGVEVKDHIQKVEGIFLDSGKEGQLMAEECKFGYRQSIFKQELKKKFIITHVTFRLFKKGEFFLAYGNVEELFRNKPSRDLMSLRETIIEIRKSKLPEPEDYGNAGSFFKNPVIPADEFRDLHRKHPGITFYPAGEMVKIPAAWLIEKAGWKGYREGKTGTWPLQPLVIVNYGNASGKDIYNLARKIKDSVKEKFNIELEPEVNII